MRSTLRCSPSLLVPSLLHACGRVQVHRGHRQRAALAAERHRHVAPAQLAALEPQPQLAAVAAEQLKALVPHDGHTAVDGKAAGVIVGSALHLGTGQKRAFWNDLHPFSYMFIMFLPCFLYDFVPFRPSRGPIPLPQAAPQTFVHLLQRHDVTTLSPAPQLLHFILQAQALQQLFPPPKLN